MPERIVANPRPASTVVVLRDSPAGPEVFMVRRHEDTAFMGGAYVFPGGRVDAADREGDERWCDGISHAVRQLGGMPRADAIAFHVAAARELFEEAGVLLARESSGRIVSLVSPDDHQRFKAYRDEVHSGRLPLHEVMRREQLRLALDALLLFAHWVTPPIDTRQFDTRFFMTRVPTDQVPAHDDTETTHSSWLTPSHAVARAAAGDILLPPPTWTTLRELERFGSVSDALAWAPTRRIVARQPKMLEENGVRMLLLPGDPGYPEVQDPEAPAETRFVLDGKRWKATTERAG